MANKRKPTALKIVQGTAQPGRLLDEPKWHVTTDAKPPIELSYPEAVAEWNRLVPLLEDQRVLTEGDLVMLATLVNTWGKCCKLWAVGSDPDAATLTQFRLMLVEFGLTPASRAKIARLPVEDEAKDTRAGLINPKTG